MLLESKSVMARGALQGANQRGDLTRAAASGYFRASPSGASTAAVAERDIKLFVVGPSLTEKRGGMALRLESKY